MHVTQQLISDYFEKEDHLFLLWDANDKFIVDDNYQLVEHMSLFITLSGEIDFQTNLQSRHADASHIHFFAKDVSIRVTRVSDDYQSTGIVFSKKFWSDTLIHVHPYTTLALVHPCVAVTPEQKANVLNFLSFIRLAKEMGKSDQDLVIKNLIMGMFCEIGKIYEEWSDSFPKRSSQNMIKEFAKLLYKNYKIHRDVDFYADSLGMSKRHFSSIVKNSTGMSAFRCIEMYVILKASSVLRNTNTSIKEIAIDFNFDDTSHFCKYFRKNMGQSPEEYRRGGL